MSLNHQHENCFKTVKFQCGFDFKKKRERWTTLKDRPDVGLLGWTCCLTNIPLGA